MIPRELNDWLQVLGLFGVLGGLIFVGLQLRLDEQVAGAEGTNASVEVQYYWTELVNENADVWVKGLEGEPLSAEDSVRFDALARAFQLSYFNSYNRARRGIIDADPERWVLEFAGEIHGRPGLERWWTESRNKLRAIRSRLDQPPGAWDAAVSEELARLEQSAFSGVPAK